jgi:CBS domain-containing protein
MKDAAIGDVIVTSGGKICGLATDRDLVVRVLAEGRDPHAAPRRCVQSGSGVPRARGRRGGAAGPGDGTVTITDVMTLLPGIDATIL